MTQREETIFHLARHTMLGPHAIGVLLKLVASHQRLCAWRCNGEGTTPRAHPPEDQPWRVYEWGERDEAKLERVRARIIQHLAGTDCSAVFQGDPRGSTVKLRCADGWGNDFGGEGLLCL